MDKQMKILVVEDDKKISRFLELELVHEEYSVQVAFDGRVGLEMAQKEQYGLILLDVMLPGINGVEVCRRIRKFSDVPIIMLTAKDDITDRVMGLDSGADDYLTKPFAIEELLARIRSLMRRSKDANANKEILNSSMQIKNVQKNSMLNNLSQNNINQDSGSEFEFESSARSFSSLLEIDNLSVDVDRHLVTKDNTPVILSKKEFDLLVYLMKNEGIVLSRDKILEHVWGYDFNGETNVIDVYIRYLRSKIDEPFNDSMIQTVRGVGYTIRK